MKPRIQRALARQGLEITQEGSVYRVKSTTAEPDAPVAEVLLPVGFPLEGKALAQLSRFAAVRHPSGGSVCHACATPDIHPGTLVPVGAVIASADVVIPQAIGTDINCGMRMHVADLGVDEFLSKKEAFVERLRGDLLLGTRDLPIATDAVRAMFDRGVGAWLDVFVSIDWARSLAVTSRNSSASVVASTPVGSPGAALAGRRATCCPSHATSSATPASVPSGVETTSSRSRSSIRSTTDGLRGRGAFAPGNSHS